MTSTTSPSLAGWEDVSDYHRRQYIAPYRSTVALAEFIRPHLPASGLAALDVACGGGANIAYLRDRLPIASWVGLDIDSAAVEIAQQMHTDCDTEFVVGDALNLLATFSRDQFDLVTSIQTVSWLDGYEVALEQMIRVLRPGGLLVVTSLFTDSLVDTRTVVTPVGDRGSFYNVYCLDRFAQECDRRGAAVVDTLDYEPDVDLPKPVSRYMGTYTETLADGRRRQFSGPLWMQWKFIAARKEAA